jgi:hypothetical protein
MRARCTNPNNASWHRYGGRGTIVCQRWLDAFENFLADMGERPAGHSIDRINPYGNYTPDNCRWAPLGVQQQNRRVLMRPTIHHLPDEPLGFRWPEALIVG